jgi:hypothetical protein
MILRTGVPLLAVLYLNIVGPARMQGSEYTTIDCARATTTAALSINTPGQTVPCKGGRAGHHFCTVPRSRKPNEYWVFGN